MRKLAMLGLLLLPVVSVSAQSKATEVSLRIGSIGFTSGGSSNLTEIDVGNGGGVGLGIYLSPSLAIEPSLNLALMHSGGTSITTLGLGVALPIYLDKSWGHKGVYFAPAVGLRSFSYTGDPTRTQYSIGGEVGSKIEVADPVSLRIGVTATDWLKKDNIVSSFNMTAFFGVSVFFRK
jgi:hypothetical protein